MVGTEQPSRSPDLFGSPATWAEATRERWRAIVEDDLRGASFDKRLVTRTYEGIEIQPLYTAVDFDPAGDPSGAPGLDPRVRGGILLRPPPTLWEIREERGEPDPGTLNDDILEDLEHGAVSVDIRLNDAVSSGLGATAPTGAMILCADDLEHALRGVALETVRVAFTPGSAFAEIAAIARAVVARRGVDPARARFAFNADPLAELARTGGLPVSVESMLERVGAVASWADQEMPGSTAVRVNTAPYHDADATATQDFGCAMATGLAYLRAMRRAGLDPTRAARQIVFRFSLSCNFFLAIAKLRAARRAWSRVLEACAVAPAERVMRIETRTGFRSLTRHDPWVNMLRNTAACFAGVVGGADTIISVPFDEPLGLPDAMARRIARNTQTIVGEEANLHRVLDPAGGSWYLESLTDRLAREGWAFFREIERAGGMVGALRSGMIHEAIASAYAARLRNIAKRRDAVTGVSEFPDPAKQPPRRERPDPAELARRASERLARRTVMPDRKIASRGSPAERFESVIAGAIAGAAVGELATALSVPGEEPAIGAPLAPHPYAEPFETIRDASEAFAIAHGSPPAVCLLAVGTPAELTARVNFAAGLFGAGGFLVREPPAVADARRAAEVFAEVRRESGAHVAVICAADALHPGLIPELAPMLHAAGARTVVVAGRPGENELAFRSAGVERFIFMGCDVVQALSELLQEEGALS
jgi:methylmalonyl-CoA mutase